MPDYNISLNILHMYGLVIGISADHSQLCITAIYWISSRILVPCHNIRSCISNNSSFRQKQMGIPDGSDGSDGTSYPLTENYMLPVAQATGLSLLDWCSALQAHLGTPRSSLGKASSLRILLVRLEIIATTYRSTIFKTYAFSLYSRQCMYVSI